MLSILEFENFYSFRDRQAIDLRAPKGTEDPQSRLGDAFPGSQEKVPKVIALFGPNASGKTSVLRALSFLAWFAKDSFQLPPEAALRFERFLDEESAHRATSLAAEFGGVADVTNEPTPENPIGTYRYELTIQHHAGKPSDVSAEKLRFRAGDVGKFRRVFSRSADGSVVSEHPFNLGAFREVRMRKNASVISTLAQLAHPFALKLREGLTSVVSNVLVEKQEVSESDMLRWYANAPQVMESLNRHIDRIDLGIRAMRFEQLKDGPIAVFDHTGLQTPMPWFLESHGTRSFIRNFPMMNHALEFGGIAVIDELDSSIHPLMLPEIVRWFHDKERNAHGAQLWASCHSASLLDILEKEEIYICEKDSLGRSKVYGLKDIRGVRRDQNYYRKYLAGVYGGVPRLG